MITRIKELGKERTIDPHLMASTITPATATKANPSEGPSAALT